MEKSVATAVNYQLVSAAAAAGRKSTVEVSRPFLLDAEDVQRVVTFILNYAEDHATVLPGRHSGPRRISMRRLPTGVTKASVWQLYRAAAKQLGERAVDLYTFKRLWKSLLPQISGSTRPQTDLCWKCHSNSHRLLRSADLSDQLKLSNLQKQQEHLRLVGEELSLYHEMNAACAETCRLFRLSLGPFHPASKNITMTYSFDYSQQVHFPSDPQQPGPMYFLTPRKCGLFGVCCDAMPKQVSYLIDEGMATKGSDSIIDYLHHFFDNYGVGETHAELYSSEPNKTDFALWYCAWRTMNGLHTKLDLHFLVAGHSESGPDCCFELVKDCFRESRVETLADIAQVVRDSSPVMRMNIPQLVGMEDGTVLVERYDWHRHLSRYFRRFSQVKRYRHFSFDARQPGVVVAKRHCDSDPVAFQLLSNPDVHPNRDMPPVHVSTGLDMSRQTYLYENIREFCSDEAKDITCPPPQSTGPQNKGA